MADIPAPDIGTDVVARRLSRAENPTNATVVSTSIRVFAGMRSKNYPIYRGPKKTICRQKRLMLLAYPTKHHSRQENQQKSADFARCGRSVDNVLFCL